MEIEPLRGQLGIDFLVCDRPLKSESTACGPSYDYPGDEDLVQLKDKTVQEM